MKAIVALIVALLCLGFATTIQAQQCSLKGVLNDMDGQPIDHAVCSMRSSRDSLFIRHTLSNPDGTFTNVLLIYKKI